MNGGAAIHVVWRYDRALDMQYLRDVHKRLQHGRLGRVAARPSLNAAGDRWTRAQRFAPLQVESSPLHGRDLEQWMTQQSHADLQIYGGPAWRMTVARVVDGGAIVSLVVSHALTDALGLCAAIAEATGANPHYSFASDSHSTPRLYVSDAVAAARRVGRVGLRRAYHALGSAVANRADVVAGTPLPASPPLPETTTAPDTSSSAVARITAFVSRDEWDFAARSRGGTPTTLIYALTCDLANKMQRTDTDGRTRLGTPMSVRIGPDDTRANAVRAVFLHADTTPDYTRDLTPIRSHVRAAMRRAATSSDPELRAADEQILLRRHQLAELMQAPTSPDTTSAICTTIPALERSVIDIDGGPPRTMAMELVNRALADPTRLGGYGGILWLGSAQYDNQRFIRIHAHNPQFPVNSEVLTEITRSRLADYGLSAHFW